MRRHRALAFMAGLLVLAVALVGLDEPAHRELRAHMLQHLLIVVVAAPLLVLGGPVQLALRAGVRLPMRAVRVVAHPVVGWSALTATMLGTHLSGVYDLALRSPPVHAAEHAAYLWSALLFWLPLIGSAPIPGRPGPFGRMLWILAAMPPMSAVAAWLGDAQQPVYAHYPNLADQSSAAALMAVGGTVPLAVIAVLATMEAMWREERRQRRREALA